MSGLRPSGPAALLYEAAGLINGGQSARALAVLQRALAEQPDAPSLLSLQGVALAEVGRPDEALAAARRAVARAPNWADGLANLGHVLQAAGQPAEAEAALLRALALEPRHAVAGLNLGCLLARTGRRAEAILRFRAVLAIEPDQLAARYNLALALQQDGQHAEALALYRALLARHPAHAEAANQAAALLMAEMRNDEAIALLDALLVHQPGHARSHNNRGTALRALGRAPEALEAYRRAAALRPDHADAWRNLGLLAADQGLLEEARAAFRHALKGKPDDPVARHMLDALEGRTTAQPPRAYVARSFDAFADAFDSQLRSLGYGVPAALVGLADELAPDRRFALALDLGCGTGLVAEAFGQRVADWTGVDLSPRMLGRADQRGCYARLAQADAVDYLAMETARFDLITAADMMIYLGDLAPLFAGVAAHLAPGGLFLCSTERLADDSLDSRLTTTGRYAQSDGYIERLAAAAGLSVLRRQPAALRQEHGRPVEGSLFALTPAAGQGT